MVTGYCVFWDSNQNRNLQPSIEKGLSDNSISNACSIAHLIPRTLLGIGPSTLALMQLEDTPLTAASGGILSGPMKYEFAPYEPSNQNITPSSSASMCWNMQQSLLPSWFLSSFPHSQRIHIWLLSYIPSPLWQHPGRSMGKKGCNTAATGHALSRLQAALMIGNPIGNTMGHISTTDNIVADDTSCIPCKSQTHTEFLKLCTQHHRLIGCHHYQPNPILISLLMMALLQRECVKPIALSRLLLTDPGRFIS